MHLLDKSIFFNLKCPLVFPDLETQRYRFMVVTQYAQYITKQSLFTALESEWKYAFSQCIEQIVRVAIRKKSQSDRAGFFLKMRDIILTQTGPLYLGNSKS